MVFVSIRMSKSLAFGSATNGAGLGCKAGCIDPGMDCAIIHTTIVALVVCVGIHMVAKLTFGSTTDRAGLGCKAGCVNPGVACRLAFGNAANRAGLRLGAGCILPGVTRRLAFGGAANIAGLGLSAGCFLHNMTVSLTIMTRKVPLQFNGLVGNRTGGIIGCNRNDGQTLQCGALRKVSHGGQIKGNCNAAVCVGSLCPSGQTACLNVADIHSSIAIVGSVSRQFATQISQNMDTIAGNCHIRAVGEGQFTGQLAGFNQSLF